MAAADGKRSFVPHLNNGGKAGLVGLMGLLSLVAVGVLAYAEKGGNLAVAAFTFFTMMAGNAMSFLMGSATPDQAAPSAKLTPLPLPATLAAKVDQAAASAALATWTCSCGAVVVAEATECPSCHKARPAA